MSVSGLRGRNPIYPEHTNLWSALYKMGDSEHNLTLDWDASYEIVLALMRIYPELDVNSIGLQQLKEMIVALPNFVDDPMLAHDGLLREILREWFEEKYP